MITNNFFFFQEQICGETLAWRSTYPADVNGGEYDEETLIWRSWLPDGLMVHVVVARGDRNMWLLRAQTLLRACLFLRGSETA